MTHFFTHHGLPLLFVVVMIESFGIPLPGETAPIAFAYYSRRAAADAIQRYGLYAAAAVAVAIALGWIVARRVRRRVEERL